MASQDLTREFDCRDCGAHVVSFGHREANDQDICAGCIFWRQAGCPPSFVCPDCKRRSYNPHDLAERYCGLCKQFFDAAGLRTF